MRFYLKYQPSSIHFKFDLSVTSIQEMLLQYSLHQSLNCYIHQKPVSYKQCELINTR